MTESIGAKMSVLVGMSAFAAVVTTVLPVYRCLSSSFLYALIWCGITANAFMGWLKAIDYDSWSMADSNFSAIISMVNLLFLVMLFFVIFCCLVFCLRWPVNLETIKELAICYKMLLIDLRNA
jgi:hypothetical protein